MSIAPALFGGEREPMAYAMQPGPSDPGEIPIDPSTSGAACQVIDTMLPARKSNIESNIAVNIAILARSSIVDDIKFERIYFDMIPYRAILSLDDFGRADRIFRRDRDYGFSPIRG